MPEPVELAPYVTAAYGAACWRAAKNWLAVWSRAGFPAKVRDGKIWMPANWVEQFPDGPGLIDALRNEMTALLLEGNKAVPEDARLALSIGNPQPPR